MDFKQYYETYWSDTGFKPEGVTGGFMSRLLSDNVQGGRWLDVGCGDGRTAGVWLASRGCEYVGVDISETGVEQARGLGLDCRVIEDASSLPFEDGEFDGVVCFEVLEHLLWPQDAVCEMRRVLRPGGQLLVTVPNVLYWHQRIELLFGKWSSHGDDASATAPWRDPHVRFFTVQALTDMLLAAGFESVAVGGLRGRLLGHVPGVKRLRKHGPTAVTRYAQARRPSFFGMNLSAVAVA